ILFFPGSTIGNFSEKKAKGFLRSLAKISNREVDLVIGIDLKKDKTVLENAYNDKKGVTEKFTLNLLKRINRELAGNINTNHFRHVAKYNKKRGCVEVFIESLKSQSIKISNRKFCIKKSEKIHIEDCYKYDENQFKKIAALSGWKKIKSWKDPNKNFSVFLLRS
ncbi:MAG: L-histidine N(alpha)-methyltransferase, partial [Pseudomonadota bacterium]|nr:L-histidine N(alpha)-methyltransferase [Pseudomonadota bacterium]